MQNELITIAELTPRLRTRKMHCFVSGTSHYWYVPNVVRTNATWSTGTQPAEPSLQLFMSHHHRIKDRSFATASLTLWNGLPDDFTLALSLPVFRHKLKTYLFHKLKTYLFHKLKTYLFRQSYPDIVNVL